MTDLSQRMALHVPGQITWPEPDTNATCMACAHFAPRGGGETRGRCSLVRAHQKVDGVMFAAARTTACPQIRRLA